MGDGSRNTVRSTDLKWNYEKRNKKANLRNAHPNV